jgi:putative heme-binding domain-containing protein
VDVLREVAVKEKLAAKIKPKQQAQLDQLTAGSANEFEERQKLIQARLTAFETAKASAEAGRAVFTQNCSTCHQIKGTGGLIGPQLDGIGNWGQKALAEKILDPNRNISEAFRNYNITLNNGQSMTGLFRRTEGQTMVFSNPSGQEFSIAKNDIKEYKASKYTLMPDQFRNTIPEKDFYALLGFLLKTK